MINANEMRKQQCSKCGGPVIWIKVGDGKPMPYDPNVVTFCQAHDGSTKAAYPNGKIIDVKTHSKKITGKGYVSHLVTCPKAGVAALDSPIPEHIAKSLHIAPKEG